MWSKPDIVKENLPFVDSVKIRILEKGESTQLKKDEKNVAIGKAFTLMHSMEWLEKPLSWKKMVRDLFIRRMGCQLPKPSEKKLYSMMFLPKFLGGLNLGMADEVIGYLKESPYPVQAAVSRAMAGVDCLEIGTKLSTMTSNPTQRGVPKLMEKEKSLIDFIESGGEEGAWDVNIKFDDLKIVRWPDVYREFNDGDMTVMKAMRAGVLPHKNLVSTILRTSLFANILELKVGVPRAIQFNTRTFKNRYLSVRETLLESAGNFELPKFEELNAKKLKALSALFIREIWVDTREDLPIYGPEGDIEVWCGLREISTWGKPALKTPNLKLTKV